MANRLNRPAPARPRSTRLNKRDALHGQHALHQSNVTASLPYDVGGRDMQLVESHGRGIGNRGAVVHRVHASPVQRGHAHRTRLAGRRHQGAAQVHERRAGAGHPQGHNLGMGRNVGRQPDAILTRADHRAIERDRTAERTLASRDSLPGFIDGHAHQGFRVHGYPRAANRRPTEAKMWNIASR